MVLLTECSRQCRRRRFAAAPSLDEGRAVMKIFEQSRRALSKNLIRPLPVQYLEDRGSGDLLSQSSVHVGARDGADYEGGASTRRRQNPNSSWSISGEGRWVIYIGKPNRLLIRISKSRRLGVQAGLGFHISQIYSTSHQKIKQQKKVAPPQGEEPGFGGPFPRTSWPAYHATPREARRASARVGLPFSPTHIVWRGEYNLTI